MATSPVSQAIQRIRRSLLVQDDAGLSDGQLLGQFIEHHDEAAFAALVRRHGPMILGVCRRFLPNHHDAEDAFQAAFLVLVRKAESITSPERLAGWLHGVAHQTALKARAMSNKRRAREKQVAELPEKEVRSDEPEADLQCLLDQELSGLPEKYRLPIILCDLEGKPRKEVARQLGWPEGTLSGRLARGRRMLASRLTRNGLTLSGGLLAGLLSKDPASAGVPAWLLSSTVKAASLVAAGQAVAGVAPVHVAALMEGVLKTMLVSKLKAVLAVVLVLGCMTTGATVLTCRTATGEEDKQHIAEKSVKPLQNRNQDLEKEDYTAWGEEVKGLQAGLGYLPGQRRTYYTGQTVKLAVRVRNVSKKAVTFQHDPDFLRAISPVVTDGEGKRADFDSSSTTLAMWFGISQPRRVDLAPGKESDLYELAINLKPATESSSQASSTLYGTGKFRIKYMRVDYPDNALGKLTTGTLELEIKPPMPAEDEKGQQATEEKKLQGTWRKVTGFYGTYPNVPGVSSGENIKNTNIIIEGNEWIGGTPDGKRHKVAFRFDASETLVIKDQGFAAGLGVFGLRPDTVKSPKRIDIKEVEGDYVTGIYGLKGDDLVIRLASSKNQGRPTQFSLGFAAKSGSMEDGVLLFYKRVPSQKPPEEKNEGRDADPKAQSPDQKVDKEQQPAAKKDQKPRPDKEQLQGKWKIVSSSYNGGEYEAGIDTKWTFKDRTVQAKCNRGGLTFYLRFRLDETTIPKRIDVFENNSDDFLFDPEAFDYLLDDPAKREEGIYSITDNTLRICIIRNKGERPTTFESKKGSNCLLIEFQKESPKNEEKDARKKDPRFPDGRDHNFGNVKRGTTVKHTFRIVNTSNIPFSLSHVRFSNSNMKGSLSKHVLQPKEEATLEVTVDTRRILGSETTILLLDIEQGGKTEKIRFSTTVYSDDSQEK